jgi:ribonuclease P protein component
MLGRVVHSDDFKRLLGTPSRSRSAHFAVHYVPSRPPTSNRFGESTDELKLSTESEPIRSQLVDKSIVTHWLGTVLPKRHARRAVTRNLLRRQIRGAVQRHAASLPSGTWLVRLRSPFDHGEFVSSASTALRRAARDELDTMLARAAR